ncbi:lipopolysaccharide export system ATP-binding protein LptB [mine drainage metagenome]|uniref:Lipopolysaccharide export system ATP-binding protein LptB n=1 Tax=mine drainage metagenome TaxID=410659 RepID=A0A1J5QCC7_9ZZZZ
MSAILEVKDIKKSFGGLQALSGCSFSVEEGSITGLIGPNGSGKTTMFNVITGYETSDSGTINFKGQDVTGTAPDGVCRLGVGRTFQLTRVFGRLNLLENIQVGSRGVPKSKRKEMYSTERCFELLDFVGLTKLAHEKAGMLSYGQRKLVELATILAQEPKVILLDEPMAGMNFEEKEDMARYIVDLNEEFGMTVMMIEHDMGVVMDISHRVMVLDFGRKIAEGDPAAVLADPHVKRAYLGEEDEVLVDPDDTPAPAETAA